MADQTIEVPAWLNLDVLIPEGVRDQLTAAAEAVERAVPALTEVVGVARAAMAAYDRAVADGGGADVSDILLEVTDYARLHTALSAIHDLVDEGVCR